MKEHSEQFLQKRKLLVVLPLLVLPFVTLAFWAMGGGKGKESAPAKQAGINTQLPRAQLKNDSLDKLSLYRQAQQDSAARKQAGPDMQAYGTADSTWGSYAQQTGAGTPATESEARVRQRLAQLEEMLRQPPQDPAYARGAALAGGYSHGPTSADASMERLEKMMAGMSAESGTADPEVAQLNSMLERIIDIQHPERYREKLKERSLANKGTVFPVGREEQDTAVPLVATAAAPPGDTLHHIIKTQRTENGFYDLSGPVYGDTVEVRAISATSLLLWS